tara:strand:- start:431 stop:1288 length:858 start_codon:yes stop_codon:yes gene_type:complete
MANTTFSGPVRSKNGFRVISENSTTGQISDNSSTSISTRDTRRYYLNESWKQKPALNAAIAVAYNLDFEVLGTNMTTALVTFDSDRAGLTITTAGADEDQSIILPHLDTNQTSWTGVGWGTENQVEWECAISTNAIDNQKIWAGLKLTNDQLVATDANQAYFLFETDGDNGTSLSDYTLLHFVYSIADTDYISALPITVAANTLYRLKITIDSNRKASIFVNGIQYNVTTTSGSTGGTAVTTGTTPTAALTDDINLIPYIGIEAGDSGAEALDVHHQAISRLIYE